MQISKITPLPSKKVLVETSEGHVFPLYQRECLQYGLKEGAECSSALYLRIQNDVLEKRAMRRCLHLLERRMYTEQELSQKLLTGHYPEEVVEKALEYCRRLGGVDDARYAECFCRIKGESYGEGYIRQCLRRKGVADELICDAGETLPEPEEAAYRLLCKRAGISHPSLREEATCAEKACLEAFLKETKNRRRVAAALVRRGFSLQTLKNIGISVYDL